MGCRQAVTHFSVRCGVAKCTDTPRVSEKREPQSYTNLGLRSQPFGKDGRAYRAFGP